MSVPSAMRRRGLIKHRTINMRAQPEAKARVPISDVCDALGVKWIGDFELLRQFKAQFVLSGE